MKEYFRIVLRMGINKTVESSKRTNLRMLADVYPYLYFIKYKANSDIQYIVTRQITKINIDWYPSVEMYFSK